MILFVHAEIVIRDFGWNVMLQKTAMFASENQVLCRAARAHVGPCLRFALGPNM